MNAAPSRTAIRHSVCAWRAMGMKGAGWAGWCEGKGRQASCNAKMATRAGYMGWAGGRSGFSAHTRLVLQAARRDVSGRPPARCTVTRRHARARWQAPDLLFEVACSNSRVKGCCPPTLSTSVVHPQRLLHGSAHSYSTSTAASLLAGCSTLLVSTTSTTSTTLDGSAGTGALWSYS